MKASSESGLCATVISRTCVDVETEAEDIEETKLDIAVLSVPAEDENAMEVLLRNSPHAES